jgi:hypothetical protein
MFDLFRDVGREARRGILTRHPARGVLDLRVQGIEPDQVLEMHAL